MNDKKLYIQHCIWYESQRKKMLS